MVTLLSCLLIFRPKMPSLIISSAKWLVNASHAALHKAISWSSGSDSGSSLEEFGDKSVMELDQRILDTDSVWVPIKGMMKVLPGTREQFPVNLAQRGEILGTALMKVHNEVFRYQVAGKLPNNVTQINLEMWHQAPSATNVSLMSRRMIMASLYSMRLSIRGNTIQTAVLILRDGIKLSRFPSIIESGDGLGGAITLDKETWQVFLQYSGAPVVGLPIDLRILFHMVVDKNEHGDMTLADFAALPVETIVDMLRQMEMMSFRRRPSPFESGLRDIKLVDEPTLVIVSDPDVNSSWSTSETCSERCEGEPTGTRPKNTNVIALYKKIPKAPGCGEARNELVSRGVLNDLESSVSTGESSMPSLVDLELGNSPNLSTDMSVNTGRWSSEPRILMSSTKKKLYGSELMSSLDVSAVSPRTAGVRFLNTIFPGANNDFIQEKVSFLLSKGRDQLMMSSFGVSSRRIEPRTDGWNLSSDDWEMSSLHPLNNTPAKLGEGSESTRALIDLANEVQGAAKEAESLALPVLKKKKEEDERRRDESPVSIFNDNGVRRKRCRRNQHQRKQARRARALREEQEREDRMSVDEEGPFEKEETGFERVARREFGFDFKFLVKANADKKIATVSTSSASSIPEDRAQKYKEYFEEFKANLEKKGEEAFLGEESQTDESL